MNHDFGMLLQFFWDWVKHGQTLKYINLEAMSSWFNGHTASFKRGESDLFWKFTSRKCFKGSPAFRSVIECTMNSYILNFLTDTGPAGSLLSVGNIVAGRLVKCRTPASHFDGMEWLSANSATKISMLIDMQLQTLDTHDAEQRRSLGGISAKTLE